MYYSENTAYRTMKLTLNVDEIAEDFFDDCQLIGITSSVKNYRFCWQLNAELGYRFRLNADIEIQIIRKKRKYFFPVYQCAGDHAFFNHFLYHNQFDGEYLLPEFKHMDFLWLIKGDGFESNQSKELIQLLKSMPCVQLAAELTNEKIRNKSNLIF